MPRSSVKTTTWRSKPNTAAQRAAAMRANRASAVSRSRSYISKSLSSIPATGSAELKVVDQLNGSQLVNTSGVIALINGVTQGTDFQNRIGRIYDNISLRIYARFQTLGVVVTDNLCRLIIFVDKQPNGILTTLPDLLTANSSDSFINLNNRDRYVILRDYLVEVQQVGSLAAPQFQMTSVERKGALNGVIDDYIKLPFRTTTNSTGNGIAQIVNGALQYCLVGNVAVGAGNPSAVISFRYRFKDP